jgi:hypothetical protein
MTARRTRQFWTDRERDTLRALWPFLTAQELAPIFGRRPGSIYNEAFKLGLRETHKHAEYWARIKAAQRARALTDPRLLSTRFAPGSVPVNKGQPMPEHVRAKCAATWFRNGQRGNKYLPVGSLRIERSSGQLQRKVQHTSHPRDWVPVSRLVWEAAHGPVPAGHLVRFKPGLATNVAADITLDRLECVSHAENMARNTRHNLPKPISDLIALRAALNRSINRRRRAQTQPEEPRA